MQLCALTAEVLGQYFMEASEGQLRTDTDAPFVCDLAMPSTSPVVACLQYLSGMLHGRSMSARWVWQFHGQQSMAAWTASCPQEAAAFRRLLLQSAAHTRRRHRLYQQPPFTLAALTDTRCSETLAEEIIADFQAHKACCRRPGLAQTLRANNADLRAPYLPLQCHDVI